MKQHCVMCACGFDEADGLVAGALQSAREAVEGCCHVNVGLSCWR